MPKNFGVAVSADDMRDRWIPFVFHERFAAVQGIGERLRSKVAIAHARPIVGKHENKRRRAVGILLKTGRIVDVYGPAS